MRAQQSGSILVVVLTVCLFAGLVVLEGYQQLWMQLKAQQYFQQHITALQLQRRSEA